MNKKINVLVFEPNKDPYEKTIDACLESYQKIVDGYIEIVYIDERNVLVCNEEGKLLNLPTNRALVDDLGSICDVVCGTFFVCGSDEESEEFSSFYKDGEGIRKIIRILKVDDLLKGRCKND